MALLATPCSTGPTVGSQHHRTLDDDLELMGRIAEASATATCAEAAEFDMSVATVRHAISEADASRRVRLAVEVAASRDAIAMDALRVAVCEFTFALRRDGITPEGVLIRLKQLIDNETLPLISAHPSDNDGHRLRDRVPGDSHNQCPVACRARLSKERRPLR